MEWIIENWTVCLAIFWMAERAVRLTPFQADDILVDIIDTQVEEDINVDDREDNIIESNS